MACRVQCGCLYFPGRMYGERITGGQDTGMGSLIAIRTSARIEEVEEMFRRVKLLLAVLVALSLALTPAAVAFGQEEIADEVTPAEEELVTEITELEELAEELAEAVEAPEVLGLAELETALLDELGQTRDLLRERLAILRGDFREGISLLRVHLTTLGAIAAELSAIEALRPEVAEELAAVRDEIAQFVAEVQQELGDLEARAELELGGVVLAGAVPPEVEEVVPEEEVVEEFVEEVEAVEVVPEE